MKTELAKAAATAAVPELAVPIEVVEKLIARRSERTSEGRSQGLGQGDIVVIPPPEKPLLIELRKQKVRVRVQKGIRIVTVEPAKGLTATETAAIVVVTAAGYGIYLAARDVERWEKKTSSSLNWLNPTTWKLPGL
jgi:hypothetical protein